MLQRWCTTKRWLIVPSICLQPPELEILEIGELSSERLRGIFRLTYTGDAHLLLSTKVQANPLTRPEASGAASPYEDVSSAFPSSTTSRGILFAARPLVVPMQLRLSSLRLKAIIVLVVSKQKGITLVFKNDPLESVDVSSTFDSVAVIQKYLQQEIEGQLREMFREDLPGIIHRLSQTWLSGRNRKPSSNKAAARTATDSAPLKGSAAQDDTPVANTFVSPRKARSSVSVPSSTKGKSPARRRRGEKMATTPSSSPPMAQRSSAINTPRAASKVERDPLSGKTASPSASPSKPNSNPSFEVGSGTADHHISYSSSSGSLGGFASGFVHDMQHYDPTYGLRPDEVRVSAAGTNFSGLARLTAQANRGLGDLAALSISERSPEEAQANPSSTSVADIQESSDLEASDDLSDDVVEMHGHGELDDLDDVPDYPSTDQEADDGDVDDLDDVEEVENIEDEAGNYSRYGYPPASAEFSTSAVEESARHTASLFGSSSAISTSPRQPPSSRFPSGGRSRTSSAVGKPVTTRVEYETVPAVGGGMVTRPRIYHIASRLQAPDVEEEDDLASAQAADSVAPSSTARGPPSSRTMTAHPNGARYGSDSGDEIADRFEEEMRGYSTDESPSAAGHESLMTLDPIEMDPASIAYRTQLYRQRYGRMYRPGYGRQSSISSTDMSSGTSSKHASQSPNEDRTARQRSFAPGSRASTAPTSTYPSTYTSHSTMPSPSKPSSSSKVETAAHRSPSAPSHRTPATFSASGSGNAMTLDASNHFMDLVNSNHTLSPFTRTLDTKGYAVRSNPVTPSSASVASATTGSGSGRQSQSSGGYFAGPTQTRPLSTISQPAAPLPLTGTGPLAGRRRTFKLGGSKSAGNTPSIPGTPISEDGSGSVHSAYRARHPAMKRWNTSHGRTNLVASTEQAHRSLGDGRDEQLSTPGSATGTGAGRSHVPSAIAPSGPVRRSSYDHAARRRYGSAGNVFGEDSEYGGLRTMGAIRE